MTIDQQIAEARMALPDAICLFRVGDFYEAFGEDARTISKLLGLTLTTRVRKDATATNADDMAGFPYHQLESYLARLIAAGRRVALCEQVKSAPQPVRTVVY